MLLMKLWIAWPIFVITIVFQIYMYSRTNFRHFYHRQCWKSNRPDICSLSVENVREEAKFVIHKTVISQKERERVAELHMTSSLPQTSQLGEGRKTDQERHS